MPHSVPARTSPTSSLKRRSDSSAPSKITTLSRSTRIGLLRLTRHSVTRQAANTPDLLRLPLGEASEKCAEVPPPAPRLLDPSPRAGIGAHVEADDQRLGGRG